MDPKKYDAIFKFGNKINSIKTIICDIAYIHVIIKCHLHTFKAPLKRFVATEFIGQKLMMKFKEKPVEVYQMTATCPKNKEIMPKMGIWYTKLYTQKDWRSIVIFMTMLTDFGIFEWKTASE